MQIVYMYVGVMVVSDEGYCLVVMTYTVLLYVMLCVLCVFVSNGSSNTHLNGRTAAKRLALCCLYGQMEFLLSKILLLMFLQSFKHSNLINSARCYPR